LLRQNKQDSTHAFATYTPLVLQYPVKMATSQLIAPSFFKKLNEEQVLTWRKETYSNLHELKTFSEQDILSLKSTTSASYETIQKKIKKKLISFTATNRLSFSNSVFIMVDSCVLGRFPLPTIISNLKKDYDLKQTNLILVVSQIGLTENYYKFVKKENYPGINFNRLNYNLDLLEGKTEFKMKNIAILETELIFDNKVLFQEEQKFLQLNKSWKSKDRNEINDNAQLELLIQLNKMFSKKCFLISRDVGLLQKTRNVSQNNSDIQAYSYF
jgi:hypothetical protein